MTKSKETAKAEPKAIVKTPATVLEIKPKTATYQALKFEGLAKVKDVIDFTGVLPAIQADLTLKIKKFVVKEGQFIIRQGEKIINVVDDLNAFDVLTKV